MVGVILYAELTYVGVNMVHDKAEGYIINLAGIRIQLEFNHLSHINSWKRKKNLTNAYEI